MIDDLLRLPSQFQIGDEVAFRGKRQLVVGVIFRETSVLYELGIGAVAFSWEVSAVPRLVASAAKQLQEQ